MAAAPLDLAGGGGGGGGGMCPLYSCKYTKLSHKLVIIEVSNLCGTLFAIDLS